MDWQEALREGVQKEARGDGFLPQLLVDLFLGGTHHQVLLRVGRWLLGWERATSVSSWITRVDYVDKNMVTSERALSRGRPEMFARDAETRLSSHVDRRNTPRARGVRSGGFFDECASGGSAECQIFFSSNRNIFRATGGFRSSRPCIFGPHITRSRVPDVDVG